MKTLEERAVEALLLLWNGRTSLAAWARAKRVLFDTGKLTPALHDYPSYPELTHQEFLALLESSKPQRVGQEVAGGRADAA